MTDPATNIAVPKGHAAPIAEKRHPSPGRCRLTANRLVFALLTLGIMLSLKLHYSQASPDQLAWILAPTARLVAWFTPAHPVYEHGVGHVDFAQGIIIAPACAGVNFLIMAFGLAAVSGLVRWRRMKDQLLWTAACLAAAYAGTLCINTLRIALSLYAYQADLHTGWLTPARLHRLTGVVLYLGALWAFHLAAEAAARRPLRPGRARHWLPPVWYLLGAVGVPLVNAVRQTPGPMFREHCFTLVLTSLVLWGAVRWLRRPRPR